MLDELFSIKFSSILITVSSFVQSCHLQRVLNLNRMSSASSSGLNGDSKSKPVSRRTPSASEWVISTHACPCINKFHTGRIARNITHFETWSSHQGCEQVSYSDLPEEAKADVTRVFDITARLPKAWIDKVCWPCMVLSD